MNEAKKAVISTKIIAYVQSGMTIDQAIDKVLGAGAYIRIAGEIYDHINAVA